MAAASTFPPIVCVVQFHHHRGPEIEDWFGVTDGADPAVDNDWAFLPFMALSDGSHTYRPHPPSLGLPVMLSSHSPAFSSTEDFSYFTLRRRSTDGVPPSSAFGISCTRQMDASELLNRPPDVTRSTVQKAVVAIADSPQTFGQLREKLSVVTEAWFNQRCARAEGAQRSRRPRLMAEQRLRGCGYLEGR